MYYIDYRKELGINNLTDAIGIEKGKRNLKQKKAIHNIRCCSNDQWQFVNGYYDTGEEQYRQIMTDAKGLFETIYSESLENVYDEGCCHFGASAKAYINDIRFCGKEFLEKVVFYYTVCLVEEAVPEVDGTEEDAKRVLEELKELKERIFK